MADILHDDLMDAHTTYQTELFIELTYYQTFYTSFDGGKLPTFIAHVVFLGISITLSIVTRTTEMFVQEKGRSPCLNNAIVFYFNLLFLLNNTISITPYCISTLFQHIFPRWITWLLSWADQFSWFHYIRLLSLEIDWRMLTLGYCRGQGDMGFL